MEDSNRSSNPSIHEISEPSRRIVLQGSMMVALAPVLGALSACASTKSPLTAGPRPGFRSVAASTADGLSVAEGYSAVPSFMWGEPVGLYGDMPAFKPDGSNTAAEQAAQIGMHHDGMHYFPLSGSQRGLLVMNHEYTDDGQLHADGMATWSAEKVRKSMAAHGVSVLEIEDRDGRWQLVRPSRFARRISASTPMALSGPAAGHALLRTAADPLGKRVLGTLNNCAHGHTPWGTYLTCEENFIYYFNGPEQPDAHENRWGLRPRERGIRWHEHEERFDAVRHPHEPNRFGWVVEIDPMDPTMTPIKRTALGRAAHEGAWVTQTADGRAVVYMGEDAQFEYLYKFVSRDRIQPGGFSANRDLLDHGALFVARFDADGSGEWIELRHGSQGLSQANGFADQGEVLIKSRQASDLLGATKMDRPEWVAIHPTNGEVYCTLTNNTRRGTAGHPGPDAANPRANNNMGHIIRWKEAGDFDARRFTWNHFVLAGDDSVARAEAKGNIKGDLYGSPDGLWFDARGLLWIQTDASASTMNKGEYTRMGNNMMLAADPATGETRRFLVGPVNCEITGAVCTPDMKTMFVNIQHPGESPGERSDPADPSRFSTWPSGVKGARPRSATVVIRKKDGGIIGT
ncbi:PhoX family protein [Ideonella sp.]|uniref:PhoX family protein n=1 Tax=Ideonella sp. TaxID=1929293 RepID=UPI0037BFC779